MSAMRDATGRLLRVTARDRARLFAVVSEAVWWVTIVDATLVRYHPDTYDGLLTGRPPADRQMIEETLAGLRFVRNRMGQYFDVAVSTGAGARIASVAPAGLGDGQVPGVRGPAGGPQRRGDV
jgi:hypothetical protein